MSARILNAEAFKAKVLAAQFVSVLSAVNNEVARMILEDMADNTHEHLRLRRPISKNGTVGGGWWG